MTLARALLVGRRVKVRHRASSPPGPHDSHQVQIGRSVPFHRLRTTESHLRRSGFRARPYPGRRLCQGQARAFGAEPAVSVGLPWAGHDSRIQRTTWAIVDLRQQRTVRPDVNSAGRRGEIGPARPEREARDHGRLAMQRPFATLTGRQRHIELRHAPQPSQTPSIPPHFYR